MTIVFKPGVWDRKALKEAIAKEIYNYYPVNDVPLEHAEAMAERIINTLGTYKVIK